MKIPQLYRGIIIVCEVDWVSGMRWDYIPIVGSAGHLWKFCSGLRIFDSYNDQWEMLEL